MLKLFSLFLVVYFTLSLHFIQKLLNLIFFFRSSFVLTEILCTLSLFTGD